MAINILNAYWQVTNQTQIWSSADLAYVSLDNPDYQAFLQAGGQLIQISDVNSLSDVMTSQLVPVLLLSGLQIISTSTPSISSTYALDDVTLNQVGTVARDSACGLGLPLELATFTYPDINGNLIQFTPSQIQTLYQAMRDYIAGVNIAISQSVLGQPTSLPTQPVTIP